MVEDLEGKGIHLVSREQNILAGQMIRATIAKLIAQSQKVVIFLTPEYLKDDTTKFEFELIQVKGLHNVILVTVGIDSPSQLEHLPTILTDIIANEQHIVWPIGLCAGGASNIQAFVHTLTTRICAETSQSKV